MAGWVKRRLDRLLVDLGVRLDLLLDHVPEAILRQGRFDRRHLRGGGD